MKKKLEKGMEAYGILYVESFWESFVSPTYCLYMQLTKNTGSHGQQILHMQCCDCCDHTLKLAEKHVCVLHQHNTKRSLKNIPHAAFTDDMTDISVQRRLFKC